MSTKKNQQKKIQTRSQTKPYPNQEDREKMSNVNNDNNSKPKIMEFEADMISHNYTDYSAKVPKGRRITSEKINNKALHDEKGLEYTDETLYERTETNASRREVTKNRMPVAPSSSRDEEPRNDQQDDREAD
jgi:hypothetical protein